jgi:hypothetical protein
MDEAGEELIKLLLKANAKINRGILKEETA